MKGVLRVPDGPEPHNFRMNFWNAATNYVVRGGAVLLLAAGLCFGYSTTQSSKKSKADTLKLGSVAKSSNSKKAHSASRKHKRVKKTSWRRGQQKIDSERTREIQEALIREHYLTGEPTGKWDERSQAAMVRFQAANGWQTKIVPDSRALIKLGLGPKNDHLLNPDSAMTSPLQPTSASEHVQPAAATPSTSGSSLPAAAEPVDKRHK